MSSGDRVEVRTSGEQGTVVGVSKKRVLVNLDGVHGNPWPFYPSELERL